MNKAALFFDVDGTLIDEQTKIVPESTLRALKQARENGHLVFINTGRTSCNTLDSMKHIPVDGYVCGLSLIQSPSPRDRQKSRMPSSA